jgi:hypothetical protein
MSEAQHQMIVLTPRRRGAGRPSIYGTRANKRIEFVVTVEQRRELERVSRETGKPLATVIREAVNEFVADYSERKVF